MLHGHHGRRGFGGSGNSSSSYEDNENEEGGVGGGGVWVNVGGEETTATTTTTQGETTQEEGEMEGEAEGTGRGRGRAGRRVLYFFYTLKLGEGVGKVLLDEAAAYHGIWPSSRWTRHKSTRAPALKRLHYQKQRSTGPKRQLQQIIPDI
jgi:hypothetical protein